MKLKDFMEKLYPQETQKLKEKLPEIYSFSKEVEVVPWSEEFQIADKNPEAVDKLEFLWMLLKAEMISEEEYKKQLKKIPYASKTVGAAIIEEKAVSFREEIPQFSTIIHELGHVFFKELDISWNSSYGGGETLLYLILKEKVEGNEETVKNYMRIYNLVYYTPPSKIKTVHSIIGKQISENLKKIGFSDWEIDEIQALMLMAGSLPSLEFEDRKSEEIFHNTWKPEKLNKLLKNNEIKIKERSLKGILLQFISIFMLDGIIYMDPFGHNYAMAYLKNIDELAKKTASTLNSSFKSFLELERVLDNGQQTAFSIATGFDLEKIKEKGDFFNQLEEKIIQPLTSTLPVERNEILIGIYGKLVHFEEEAKNRIKDYLEKNKKLELPYPVQEILKENNLT